MKKKVTYKGFTGSSLQASGSVPKARQPFRVKPMLQSRRGR